MTKETSTTERDNEEKESPIWTTTMIKCWLAHATKYGEDAAFAAAVIVSQMNEFGVCHITINENSVGYRMLLTSLKNKDVAINRIVKENARLSEKLTGDIDNDDE